MHAPPVSTHGVVWSWQWHGAPEYPAWLYTYDKSIKLPYQDHLSALIHEPTFRNAVGDAVFTKTKLIKDLGNMAVHSTRKVMPADALTATRELFHVCYWLARTYGKRSRSRKALVVATGGGKTRIVIALADLMMRCNRAKRILFLADRVALIRQATNAFKTFLSDSSPVNLVTEKNTEGRVYLSTYPTMMGLIDEASDGQKRFGVGHFDLIVRDEAHRSS